MIQEAYRLFSNQLLTAVGQNVQQFYVWEGFNLVHMYMDNCAAVAFFTVHFFVTLC